MAEDILKSLGENPSRKHQIGFNLSQTEIFTLASLPGFADNRTRHGVARHLDDLRRTVYACRVNRRGGRQLLLVNGEHRLFLPEKNKRLALGINAGVGNLGVSLICLTAPILLGMSFGGLFGDPLINVKTGAEVYIQSVCCAWAVPTVLTLVLIWLFMDNLPLPKQSPKSILSIFGNKHTWLMTRIYTCGFGQFIGCSAALMLLLNNEFPEVSMAWDAFLEPFIGAGMRPVGGRLADKVRLKKKIGHFLVEQLPVM